MFSKLSLFFFVLLFPLLVQGVFIEKVPLEELNHKKIIYFNGSFDPFHKGHAAMVVALKNYVDYIIVFPIDGKNSRKPWMTDKKYRQEMVETLYKDDPKVCVTKLNGYELQTLLSRVQNTSFFGMIGADVLEMFKGHEEIDKIYLRGTPLKPEEGKLSKAAMSVVNVEAFYIFARGKIPIPEKFMKSRTLIKLKEKIPNISSSMVQQIKKRGDDYSSLVPRAVAHVIKKYNLYR